MLTGLKAIAKFSGYRIQTISTWKHKPPNPDDPAPFVDVDNQVTVDPVALREWLIRNGKTKVQQPKSIAEIRAANKAVREAKKPGRKPSKPYREPASESDDFDSDSPGGLDDFIDAEIYAAFPLPTGNIEDEIAHARKLRHMFGALVGSWKLKSLSNPKTARTFRDFAAELVRQIAVIGRLEEGLTKQRLRLGRLLDEQSVMTAFERLADAVAARFNSIAVKLTELAANEVAALAAAAGTDISLDGDKFRKLALKILDKERSAHGEEAIRIAEAVKDEQGERMGAEDSDS